MSKVDSMISMWMVVVPNLVSKSFPYLTLAGGSMIYLV